MYPGIIPTFASPGVIAPGQFGPISLAFFPSIYLLTLIISRVGIPSVMHTTRLIPASTASTIASAANGAGTNISEVFAFVSFTASNAVLNTWKPSTSVPPFPGVTPPTTLVPYSRHWVAWKSPALPVIPCTTTRVSLFTRMLITSLLL